MKLSILEPTKDNLIKTIYDDTLNRNREVYSLALYCDRLPQKTSIALESPWGSGKTFFVKQTKLLLDAYNAENTDLDDKEVQVIKYSFQGYGRESLKNNHICVYYDAWGNDSDEDPLLSIVYEIVKTTGMDYKIRDYADFTETGKKLVNLLTEDKGGKLLELFEKNDLLKELREEKDTHQRIEEFIEKLLEEENSRLILFIDELDRCRPSFAVSLLEKVKHYFTHDRVTVVYSTNLVELSHTIKHVYGQGFDADRYLDKFFDQRFSLPKPELPLRQLLNHSVYDDFIFVQVSDRVIQYFDFSIRETVHYYELLEHALSVMDSHPIFTYPSIDAQFIRNILLPLAIGLRIKNTKSYYDFIEGRNSELFGELFSSSEMPEDCTRFIYDNYLRGKEVPKYSYPIESAHLMGAIDIELITQYKRHLLIHSKESRDDYYRLKELKEIFDKSLRF